LLAATTSAYAQFDLQDSHITASLRGIHSIGEGVAWASGTDGTVLRTLDGGALWQPCTTPPGAEKLDFRGIQAFDRNTAIVMSSGKGDLSRLYKTTDGCRTWKLVFTNPDKEGFWDAIQFDLGKQQSAVYGRHNRCFGAMVGDPVDKHFAFFLTFDCGDHWEKQIKESPEAQPGESLFAASNSALVVNDIYHRSFVTGGRGGSRLLSFFHASEDTVPNDPSKVMEGTPPLYFLKRFWREETIVSSSSSDSSGAFSAAANRMRKVVVGGDYRQPNSTRSVAWFEDYRVRANSLWRPAITPPHGYRSSVAYDPTHKTWITVGPNGSDLSTDDGRNWHPLKPTPNQPPSADKDTDKNWNALSLPFVVGPHGRIGKLRSDALLPALLALPSPE